MKPSNSSFRNRGAVAGVVCLLSLLFCSGPVPAADCNGNRIDDAADIAAGTSQDCNADGRPDECELATGAIAFDEPRIVLGGEAAYGYGSVPVVADLDGDGDFDIAASQRAVALLFNRGDGVFAEPEFAATELGPGETWHYIIGEDLDGDGDLDLVLSGQRREQVAILTNDGNGGFTVSQVAPSPGHSREPKAEDFDLDGDLDLIWHRFVYDDELETQFSFFALLRNRGDGSFDEVETLPVRSYSGSPHPVDLDGDGFPDLVSTYRDRRDESGVFLDGGVVVQLNAGDGSFPASVSISLGGRLGTFLTGDFDGDADIDLVAAVHENDAVFVLRNRGDGSFERPVEVPAGGLLNLRAADINADGDLDLIAFGHGDFEILSNDGNGVFKLTRVLAAVVSDLETVDLDGDGQIDLVTTSYIDRHPRVELRRNLGSGVFGEPVRYSLTDETGNLTTADLDADGDLDLVVGRPLHTLRNVTGDESFAFGCAEFLRGDANADGIVSLADVVTITRFQNKLICRDAADANDDEVADLCDAMFIASMFVFDDNTLPAPYPAPGTDPTVEPAPLKPTFPLGCHDAVRPSARSGCAEYIVDPPRTVDDTLRIGDVFALPGGQVSIPIFVTTAEPVEGVQLVFEYDPDVLEFGDREIFLSLQAFDFEDSFFGQFDPHPGGWPVPFISFRADPEQGLAFVGIVSELWSSDFDIPPGEDILVAKLRATVSPDVPPETLISLEPTNGPDGEGVGPYSLRNELVHRGDARFVSVLPRTKGGLMKIVGDQSYFIRSDSNGDWLLDISDPLNTLGALFLGGPGLWCPDAADSNDDGALDISDPVSSLHFLFVGDESPPPPPYPQPGPDPTPDGLRCLRVPRS